MCFEISLNPFKNIPLSYSLILSYDLIISVMMAITFFQKTEFVFYIILPIIAYKVWVWNEMMDKEMASNTKILTGV